MTDRKIRQNKEAKNAAKVVLVSFITNIFDISISLVVALLTGSVSVLAQAFQAMADLTTSGTLVLGVKRSEQHASEEYPFGYGREVFFWVLISSMFMLVFTGGASMYFGIERILNPEPIQSGWLAIGALSVAVLTNGYAFSLSYKELKKSDVNTNIFSNIRTSSLLELKTSFLIDGAGMLAAILGLIAVGIDIGFGLSRFDGVGSLLVGVLMTVFALLLIRDVKNFLVGKSATKRTQIKIEQAALSIKGVQEVLDMRTMYLGSARLLVVIELHIDERFKTKSIEQLSDEVKKKILKRVPRVEIVQVEVETPDHEVNE